MTRRLFGSWPLGPRPALGFSDQKTTGRVHRPEYSELELVSEDYNRKTALPFGQHHGPIRCPDVSIVFAT